MTNIIIAGVNYAGQMASSQRIKNLFDPLLQNENLSIANLIVNENIETKSPDKLFIKVLKYKLFNPFSVLSYLFSSIYFSFIKYDKKALNVIYYYGYPSVENILLLKSSKLIGYKIVFDIVENIKYYDHSKSTSRMRFKNYTSKILLNQLYKTGSLCFAISSDLVALCKGITRNMIPVIKLPISVDVDYVNSFKRINTIDKMNNNIKIFYGGSFGFKDGISFLIRGFEMACDINSDIELVLTGKISKQYEGTLQLLISNSRWAKRIRYLGCLSEIEYFETMVNSDILCMMRVNTPYAHNGFPFKLGEYLASGNAVIATDVGDISKYLETSHNAIIIKPESESAICNAILLLSRDKSLRTKIGLFGREIALKHFSARMISTILWQNILKLKNV